MTVSTLYVALISFTKRGNDNKAQFVSFSGFSICLTETYWGSSRLKHGLCSSLYTDEKGKGSPYSTTERRVPELIPVLGSQPAGDVSHKPGGRLPLLSARPAVTPATLKRAATSFAAW